MISPVVVPIMKSGIRRSFLDVVELAGRKSQNDTDVMGPAPMSSNQAVNRSLLS